jgi:ATP-binding cassette subfamily F protein uup
MTMPEDKRVLDVIRDIAEYIPLEKGGKISASQLLQRFLFEPERQQVMVQKLSGGERRRLFLLTILIANPNFLIFDEPTNDLDIATLRVLEDYLMQFPGCLLVVTHDRYFMDRITDHLFVFTGGGGVQDFNGTYGEYRTKYPGGWQSLEEKNIEAGQKAGLSKTGLTQEEQKELRKLEKQIATLEGKKQDLMEAFMEASTDVERLQRLTVELKETEQSLEAHEMRWMELMERN